MSFTLPPLSFSSGPAVSDAKSAGSVVTPIDIPNIWNSTKVYNNHSDGASISAAATANPTSGGAAGASFGGLDLKWILLGAGAWFLLR